MKRARTTSLWQLIQSIQERMEAEGLSVPVVDAIVTRGLEAVLREAENDGDLLPV